MPDSHLASLVHTSLPPAAGGAASASAAVVVVGVALAARVERRSGTVGFGVAVVVVVVAGGAVVVTTVVVASSDTAVAAAVTGGAVVGGTVASNSPVGGMTMASRKVTAPGSGSPAGVRPDPRLAASSTPRWDRSADARSADFGVIPLFEKAATCDSHIPTNTAPTPRTAGRS